MAKKIRPENMITLTGIFTTIFFFNPLFDPNILPKLIALICGVSVTLFIFSRTFDGTEFKIKHVTYLCIAYLGISIVGGIENNQTIYQILIGSWGRYNGLVALICFFVLFIVGSLSKFPEYPKLIISTLNFLGHVMVFVGLLEYFGYSLMDVNARDPHIKLTLGNSNFAGIFLVMTFSATLTKIIFVKNSMLNKSLMMASLIGQLFLIFETNASQAYVSLCFSIFFLTGAWFINKENNLHRKIGFGIWTSIPLIGLLTIYSILVRNSFGNFLSSSSLYDRFYAWQAALAMLKQNLFFGVGIDSYGLWFQNFRSPESTQKQLASENFDSAHNIYLNIAANGGLLLAILYLVLIGLIAHRGYSILKSKLYDGYVIGLIGIWLVYQLQSIVSIDHITLNTWHWIIAGAIYSASYNQPIKQSSRIQINSKTNKLLFIPVLLLISIVVYILPTLSTEYKINKITNNKTFILGSNEMKSAGVDILQLSLDSRYPEIRIYCIYTLVKFGYLSDALKLALDTTSKFPRSINSWEALAQIYEMSGEKKLAAESWQKALSLAPLNEEFRSKILENLN